MRHQQLPDRNECQPFGREQDEQRYRSGCGQALVAVTAAAQEPAQTLTHHGHPATVPRRPARGTPAPGRPPAWRRAARRRGRPAGSSASTSSCSPDRQGERLVGLRAAERHELLRLRPAGEDVAVGDRAHRDVGDERPAVARGDRDRERVRPGQRRPARGRRQTAGRGGGEQRDQAAVRQLPRPVAERAGRERLRADDQAGTIGRRRRAGRRRRPRASDSRARRRRPSARTPAPTRRAGDARPRRAPATTRAIRSGRGRGSPGRAPRRRGSELRASRRRQHRSRAPASRGRASSGRNVRRRAAGCS